MPDPTFDTAAMAMDQADAQALEAIQQANLAPDGAEPSVSPSKGQEPAAAAPVAGQPSIVSHKDDDLVEVMVGGQKQQIPWKDARQGIMFQADYTRKSQMTAAERKQVEGYAQQLKEREQAINDFLLDPGRLKTYLNVLEEQVRAAQPPGPSELVNAEHLQMRLKQLEQQHEQRLQQQLEQVRVQHEAAGLKGQLDKALHAALDEYPALKAVKGISQLLYDEVRQLGPTSVEEAQQMLVSAVKAQAEELNKHYQEQNKQRAVSATKLKQGGIEPTGGAVVLPKGRQYKDFDATEDDAIAAIEQLMHG